VTTLHTHTKFVAIHVGFFFILEKFIVRACLVFVRAYAKWATKGHAQKKRPGRAMQPWHACMLDRPFVDRSAHAWAYRCSLIFSLWPTGCVQTAGRFVQKKNLFLSFGINRSESIGEDGDGHAWPMSVSCF
jgi:hypothetical protein